MSSTTVYSKSMLAILFLVPYGWTVVGALLMCWMVMQLDNRKDKKKARRVMDIYTTVYGSMPKRSTRIEGNRETWKNFFNDEDF